MRIFRFFRFFWFLGVDGGGGAVGVVELVWGVGSSVEGVSVDVNEDAHLSCGDDGEGLGVGGARWWVCYRFPKAFGELWDDFKNNLLFFFNFQCHVFLVNLERRRGKYGGGAYWQMRWIVGEFQVWSILKWEFAARFGNECWDLVRVRGMRWYFWGEVLLFQGQSKLKDTPSVVDEDGKLGENSVYYRVWEVDLWGAFWKVGYWNQLDLCCERD